MTRANSICIAGAKMGLALQLILTVLDAVAPVLPEPFGGSADLIGSNLTNFKGCVSQNKEGRGNYLVRRT